MADNTTLNSMSGGDVVEDIDGANGSTGVKRQVVSLGGIGKSGSHTALVAGQATAANSIPVVLSSDPDSRPASGTITAQDTGSSSASGQDSIALVTGSASANSTQSWAINGQATARLQVTGTWTGTLAFEGSIDGGATWFAQPARVSGLVHTRSSVTANGLFEVNVAGLTNLRVRSTTAMTGTATVRATFSSLLIDAPPAGVGVVGQRPFLVKGTVNNGQTSYAANLCIGGLITVAAGLPAGAILTNSQIKFKGTTTTWSTPGSITVLAFDANPSGSTYTDNVTGSLNSADLPKLIDAISLGGPTVNGQGLILYRANFNLLHLPIDSSGNLYLALLTNNTNAFSATNVLVYELDGIW